MREPNSLFSGPYKREPNSLNQEHEHCWHAYSDSYMMVFKPGEILQNCCKCPKTQTIHRNHASKKW